jgi:hypothetical protein
MVKARIQQVVVTADNKIRGQYRILPSYFHSLYTEL